MDVEAVGMQAQATRLTLEEQVANVMKNTTFNDKSFFSKLFVQHRKSKEVVRRVVQMLRDDPNRTDVQTLPETQCAYLRGGTSLQWAVRMGDKSMVAEILEAGIVDFYSYNSSDANGTALHDAIRVGDIDIVKLMLAKHSELGKEDILDFYGAALHYAVDNGNIDVVKLIVAEHLKSGKMNVNAVARYRRRYTALHLAVVGGKSENIDMVRELLKCKDTMRLSEEDSYGRTPLQIAHERGYKDVQKALMEHESVRRYIEELYRDRQVYVDAANAILVGAALIASVTFGSWLQPPLGITSGYADVEHNKGLGAFWIFNSLSFYFAIATVVFGARSVLPRNVYFIKRTVERLRNNLLITAFMLACSVFFVVTAFGIAGCIVLTPRLKYRWYMIVPTMVGGLVCLISLGYLSWSIWEDSFGRKSIARSIQNSHNGYTHILV